MPSGQKAPIFVSPEPRPLETVRASSWVEVTNLLLEPAQRQWLEAMGLMVGERVLVLRRAPFGGPYHVRLGSGGELALDRAYAARIEVRPFPEDLAA